MKYRLTMLLLLGVLAAGWIAVSSRGQSPTFLALLDSGGTACTTNVIAVSSLTNLSTTANTNWYITPVFTPASNSTVIAYVSFTPALTLGEAAVTNQGASQLTWWRAGSNSVSVTQEFWVTQLAQGVTPFAMQLSLTGTNFTGAEIHIVQVTGANQSAAFGTNAILQTVFTNFSVNAGNAGQISFAAPAAHGSNAIVFGLTAQSSVAVATMQTGWTELLGTAHSSPAHSLEDVYRLAVPSSVTSVFFTNTGAGTMTAQACLAELRVATSCD